MMFEERNVNIQKWLVHGLTAVGFFIAGIHFLLMSFNHQFRVLDIITRVLPSVIIFLWVFLKGARTSQVCFVLIALLLNALGDLMLKFPGDLFFILGLISHLLSHIMYIISFTIGNHKVKIVRAILPFIYLGFMVFLLLPATKGVMRYAVLLYSCVIIIMLWRAAAAIGQAGKNRKAEVFRLIGAVLFVFSDTLLAIKVFIQDIEGICYPLIGSYWTGLWLIAFATIILNPFKREA